MLREASRRRLYGRRVPPIAALGAHPLVVQGPRDLTQASASFTHFSDPLDDALLGWIPH